MSTILRTVLKIVLLAGGRAGNVTGSDFLIDGGLLQTIR